jgi:toxin ParE1/3/4
MVEVIWTKKAINQLENAVKYIKNESGKYYAEIVLNKILSSTRFLNEFPLIGQTEPLLKFKKSEYRYLVVWSYKIVYRVTKERVTISRVFHTSQNPEKLKSFK